MFLKLPEFPVILRMLRHVFTAVVLAVVVACGARPIKAVDGRKAQLLTSGQTHSGAIRGFFDGEWHATDHNVEADGDLIQRGERFNLGAKGDPAYHRLWLDNENYYAAPPGLAYEFLPTPVEVKANDKIMHELFGLKDPKDFPAIGETRFTGMAFMLPEDAFETPDSPVMLFQQKQGSPHTPILAVYVVADGDDGLKLSATVTNDAIGANPSAPRLEILQGHVPVQRGVWNRIVFMVEPRHAGMSKPGQVKIWHFPDPDTEESIVIADWSGPIGYDPELPQAKLYRGVRPAERYEITFGIYRNTQSKLHRAYFDDVLHAATMDLATPHRTPAENE